MTTSSNTAKSRRQTGLAPRQCPVCQVDFSPYREYQRACSRKCRDALGAIDPSHPNAVITHYACIRCGDMTSSVTNKGTGKFALCSSCAADAAVDRAKRKNEVRKAKWHSDPGYRANQRAIQLRSNYGLTVERYDEMLAQQGGLCAICANPPKPDGNRAASRLVVDHDHETGQVRRLLCNNCNRALGYFGDDIATLTSALHYLTLWKGRPKD